MAGAYPINRWLFEEAHGRYDIDLGDSYVECGSIKDLSIPADLTLDYGQDRGSVALRTAIGDLYRRGADEVGVTHGGQEALYLLYRTLLRAGDHVVAFTPGWRQALAVPSSMGCVVDAVRLTADGGPDVAAALEVIGPQTRMVVLNSPCNPTGTAISPQDARTLIEATRRVGAYLVLDEEYVVDLAEGSLVSAYERAVSVSGVSKVYGFPGLRVGWMCGPIEVVRAAMDQKHFTSICNSVLMELLAGQVLADRDRYLARYKHLTAAGREILRQWVGGQEKVVRMLEPGGTPYTWLELTTEETSLNLCRRILTDAGVLLMPAEVFGAQHGVRITFAREPATLTNGLARIGKVLAG